MYKRLYSRAIKALLRRGSIKRRSLIACQDVVVVFVTEEKESVFITEEKESCCSVYNRGKRV